MTSLFKNRSNLLLFLFVLWGGLLLLRLYQIMGVDRDDYLRQSQGKSWKIGVVPALRGRILNQNGEPLSWSVRFFSLYYNVPTDQATIDGDLSELKRISDIADNSISDMSRFRQVMIESELTPEGISTLQAFVKENSRFFIRSRFERRHSRRISRIQRVIGNTTMINNHEVGVSGLERRFNNRLRGIDGRFRVMIDKDNVWITETWEELQAPHLVMTCISPAYCKIM